MRVAFLITLLLANIGFAHSLLNEENDLDAFLVTYERNLAAGGKKGGDMSGKKGSSGGGKKGGGKKGGLSPVPDFCSRYPQDTRCGGPPFVPPYFPGVPGFPGYGPGYGFPGYGPGIGFPGYGPGKKNGGGGKKGGGGGKKGGEIIIPGTPGFPGYGPGFPGYGPGFPGYGFPVYVLPVYVPVYGFPGYGPGFPGYGPGFPFFPPFVPGGKKGGGSGGKKGGGSGGKKGGSGGKKGGSGGKKSSGPSSSPSPSPSPSSTESPFGTIGEELESNGYTLLVAALEATGLIDAVNDPNADLTIFAPENEAFLALGDELDRLLANPEELSVILLDHVVAGVMTSAELIAAQDQSPITVDTLLEGQTVDVIINDSGIRVKGLGNKTPPFPQIVAADIPASNGIIHGINGIILPGAIFDVLQSNGFTKIAAAIVAAGLKDVVNDPENQLTLFAPTNAAVGDALDDILHDPEALTVILLTHVVNGVVSSSDLIAEKDQSPLTVPNLVAGQKLHIFIQPNNNIFVQGEGNPADDKSKVVIPDLRATNGYIHGIDGILLNNAHRLL